MFSNLILRNSRRSRKENGLFFSSLVISIVAFYMILSISTQDVMLFLQKMESCKQKSIAEMKKVPQNLRDRKRA